MGFSGQGAASGAAAGSAFGPWGAAIGGVAGGLFGDSSSSSTPAAPVLANPTTPGAVVGQYGNSYIDPVTGQITYNSSAGNLSQTSLLNQNLQSQLMGYGGTGNSIAQQIAQQQAQLSNLQNPQGLGPYSAYSGLGGLGNNSMGTNPGSSPMPKLSDFYPPGTNMQAISMGGFSKGQTDAAAQNYANALKTWQGNQAAQNAQISSLQNNLQTLQGAQSQLGDSNPILDYLNHGPDQANYLQQETTKQFQNAQLANQNQNSARGMGSSSMQEIGTAGNDQNLALGILGAQNQAGQQNFANRNTMLNYLSGQNAQDLSAEQMRGSLNNQQMAQGQGVGQNMSNMTTQQNAAQAGLNFQGNMAGYNANQTNNIANQNGISSAAGIVGNSLGQSNTANAMQNWLNGQNNMQYQYNGGAGGSGVQGSYGAQNYWTNPSTPAYTPYPTTGQQTVGGG